MPDGVTVERRGDVVVVAMDRGENRLHPEMLDALEAALGDVATGEDPAAFVLTGSGKFFSNGLDLEYMGQNADEVESIVARVHGLFGTVLGLDVPTVAAVNGHAFAGGAMLALSFDLAVMREDRGYFCLPEADLGIPFTPPMNALIKARLDHSTAHRAMTTGHRFTGPEALAGGIVTELAPEDEVLDRAVALAAGLVGKPRHGLGQIKRGMYGEVLDLLGGATAA